MKQGIKKLKLRKQHAIYLVVFMLTGAAILASKAPNIAIHAASSDYMYLSPSSGSHSAGSTFTVQIKENSYTDTVNAVQADLTYPTAKLQFVSTSLSGTAFGVTASNTGGSGNISIALGTIAAVSGDKLVATVTFKALASGTANVTFKNSSAVLSSTTNQNVAVAFNGGTYTIPGTTTPPPPSPTPSPTPHPSPTPPPSSGSTKSTPPPPPATSIAPKNNPKPVTIPDNSQVELNEQATVQTTPTNTGQVTKIEYYLNDKKVATVTQAPYNYSVDTTNMRNGTYKLTTKTYYQDGQVAAKNTSVIVKNPFGWNQFRLQARHYFAYVVIIILLIGFGTWYLIQRRGDQYLNSHMGGTPTSSGGPGNEPTAHVGTM
ncbi:MAG TPA: Ig-like domain-containing protein [Candidatus Saccharimonadales bacterium]|nr:Ig-like domain-containing protein [Candidatus Saccharimonadales bacterium]